MVLSISPGAGILAGSKENTVILLATIGVLATSDRSYCRGANDVGAAKRPTARQQPKRAPWKNQFGVTASQRTRTGAKRNGWQPEGHSHIRPRRSLFVTTHGRFAH